MSGAGEKPRCCGCGAFFCLTTLCRECLGTPESVIMDLTARAEKAEAERDEARVSWQIALGERNEAQHQSACLDAALDKARDERDEARIIARNACAENQDLSAWMAPPAWLTGEVIQ